jgi:hypothetical protein
LSDATAVCKALAVAERGDSERPADCSGPMADGEWPRAMVSATAERQDQKLLNLSGVRRFDPDEVERLRHEMGISK